MSGEKLGHAEGTDAVGTENLSHLFVGGKKLFVCGILEVVLLEVNPQFLDAFSKASHLLANDGDEVSTLSFMGLVSPDPLGMIELEMR